jgi:hypothetical protein
MMAPCTCQLLPSYDDTVTKQARSSYTAVFVIDSGAALLYFSGQHGEDRWFADSATVGAVAESCCIHGLLV